MHEYMRGLKWDGFAESGSVIYVTKEITFYLPICVINSDSDVTHDATND